MERPIKFRGMRVPDHLKKKNDGTWRYGYLYESPDKRLCVDEWYVDPKTVGQFTGLKDKNGAEIYEGDVVRIYPKPTSKQSEQYWPWDNMPLFKVRWVETGYVLSGISDDWNTNLKLWNRPCEVIGNIYESPQLLEGRISK